MVNKLFFAYHLPHPLAVAATDESSASKIAPIIKELGARPGAENNSRRQPN